MKTNYFLILLLIPFIFISCKSTDNLNSNQNVEPQLISEETNPERYIYKHVIIVGIDGAGSFESKCNTPNMDSIFSEGIWTSNCSASVPSISAQCWGSIMTGVIPSVHKLNNKRIKSGIEYNEPAYPTIFKLARETKPDSKLAAFCNWTPIYKGIIERNIGVITEDGNDADICKKATDFIIAEKPDLMFIHFCEVDSAGHKYGFGKKEFLETLEKTDVYVGEIFESIKEAGILDDTLFIVTADHGGIARRHGGILPSELQVYLGATGKTVNKSNKLKLKERDLAAIVCHALNLKTNKKWSSKLPKNFFNE